MANLPGKPVTKPMRVEVKEDGSLIAANTAEDIRATTGLVNMDASRLLLNQVGQLFADDVQSINEAMAILHELKPSDAIESMLCSQLVGLHCFSMRTLARMNNSDYPLAVDNYINRTAKLANAQAKLLDALHKHRHGGRQMVTVQHVNVSDGGQAIIGAVTPRGEGQDGN